MIWVAYWLQDKARIWDFARSCGVHETLTYTRVVQLSWELGVVVWLRIPPWEKLAACILQYTSNLKRPSAAGDRSGSIRPAGKLALKSLGELR